MDLNENECMPIMAASLPPDFDNEIVESNSNLVCIRSNIKCVDDINKWVKEFGIRTDTNWNIRRSCRSGDRFVCMKKFVCQHSAYQKVPLEKITKGISKNAECLAFITLKVKLDTTHTRNKDKFIRRGLFGVITINPFHKHSLKTAAVLRFLPAIDCREEFEEYFNDGMGAAESAKFHESIIELNPDFRPSDLANSRINPTSRTISYWYDQWRRRNLGPQNGHEMIEACITDESEIQTTYSQSTPSIDEIPCSPCSSSQSDVSHSSGNNSCVKELSAKLLELLADGFKRFPSSEQDLEKAVKHVQNISSEGQWGNMLASLGDNVPLNRKAGAAIKVQPASISQRSFGVTSDSKQMACGRRPSNGSHVSKKRKHNLS